MNKFCKNCGKELAEGTKFCINCEMCIRDRFKQVAQDCYIEQMKAFSKLFEDKRFYDTVMATLAQETYRHSNDCAL